MPADCNVILREDKSFVYDLDVQRGIVSSRVALLLRSAEIKPLLSDLLFPRRSWREPAAVRICGGLRRGNPGELLVDVRKILVVEWW